MALQADIRSVLVGICVAATVALGTCVQSNTTDIAGLKKDVQYIKEAVDHVDGKLDKALEAQHGPR